MNAAHGGKAARAVPRRAGSPCQRTGHFPPVLLHVNEGRHRHDEMHVGGGVTTSVVSTPVIAGIRSVDLPQLHGAHLYMIVNGQLARTPQTTPLFNTIDTIDVLANSMATEMTYKTREAVLENIASAQRLGVNFPVGPMRPARRMSAMWSAIRSPASASRRAVAPDMKTAPGSLQEPSP